MHARIPPSPKANICLILFLIERYDYSQYSAEKEREKQKVVCAVRKFFAPSLSTYFRFCSSK